MALTTKEFTYCFECGKVYNHFIFSTLHRIVTRHAMGHHIPRQPVDKDEYVKDAVKYYHTRHKK